MRNPRRDPKHILAHHYPDLGQFEELYKDIHQHPELGRKEGRTALLIKEHFERLDLDVKTNIGGHGVIGILKNGAGPTVLIRGELDALPIREQTGLPYASKAYQRDSRGIETPVMHACGHDMHIACLLAVVTLLKSARAEWDGTLICLFQPDEETGAGAQAMVDDGLYTKIPIPDVILFQHVDHQKTGTLSICSGPTQAAADSFDVKIFGRGGHAAQPESCIDPIVIASCIVVRLQSIVSREVAPSDTAVITCGSIHAGESANTIPDHADLKLNIRTFDVAVRNKVISAVKRVISSECRASGVEKEPEITTSSSFPLTDNNSEVVSRVKAAWACTFGDKVHFQDRKASSEDLPNLATSHNIPYAVWFFGGTDAATWDDAMGRGAPELIPRNHSAFFAPAIQPTLRTGIDAMTLAVLSLMV
ncbi:hypothetical protein MMC17_005526 [Xylographa soralifera]|nr:hypothetical protein [Xylographa soralifera]